MWESPHVCCPLLHGILQVHICQVIAHHWSSCEVLQHCSLYFCACLLFFCDNGLRFYFSLYGLFATWSWCILSQFFFMITIYLPNCWMIDEWLCHAVWTFLSVPPLSCLCAQQDTRVYKTPPLKFWCIVWKYVILTQTVFLHQSRDMSQRNMYLRQWLQTRLLVTDFTGVS